VHDDALVELQESVEEPPEITAAGLADIVTVGVVGAGVTVTVTDWVAEPPAPVQASEYVALAVRIPVVCDPEVVFVPDQAPEAVQEVALVELQFKVEAPPEVMEAGVAEIATVGIVVGVEPGALFI
jgi:hypothetical protein